MAQTTPPAAPAEGGGWAHRLALLTSGATLLLILVGGLVTSLGAGLAVPDWPTSFGYPMFAYPWSKMVGGIFYEHSHRLLGSLTGFLTFLTVAVIWAGERRKWVRMLGSAALCLVILQGVLGGLRVVLIKIDLAIVHASVAQLFFGLIVSLALFTSPGWARAVHSKEGDRGLRRLALAAAGLIYVQTIFGAVLRHTGSRLDAHLLFAALATASVLWLAARAIRTGREDLLRPANALWGLLLLQLALGTGSFLGKYTAVGDYLPREATVLFTSLHVAVGSLLFAAALVMALRLHRGKAPDWTAAQGEPLPERTPA